MAQIAYKRLVETLAHIEPKFRATGTFDDDIASALCDAWVLIDVLHRLRELTQATRLVAKKSSEAQIFLRHTRSAEDLRHYFQHFRTGIHGLPDQVDPLFGTLSWVSKRNANMCYSILSGKSVDGVVSYGCTYDRLENKFCQSLLLSAGKAEMDLAVGFAAINRFSTYFMKTLRDKGAAELTEGALGLAMQLQIVRAKQNTSVLDP